MKITEELIKEFEEELCKLYEQDQIKQLKELEIYGFESEEHKLCEENYTETNINDFKKNPHISWYIDDKTDKLSIVVDQHSSNEIIFKLNDTFLKSHNYMDSWSDLPMRCKIKDLKIVKPIEKIIIVYEEE